MFLRYIRAERAKIETIFTVTAFSNDNTSINHTFLSSDRRDSSMTASPNDSSSSGRSPFDADPDLSLFTGRLHILWRLDGRMSDRGAKTTFLSRSSTSL
jgi:hypothetical protein